jgi:hypothetical protein
MRTFGQEYAIRADQKLKPQSAFTVERKIAEDPTHETHIQEVCRHTYTTKAI